MSNVGNVPATRIPIQAMSPSKRNLTPSCLVAPYTARLVGGDAVLGNVMSLMAPYLIFSVSMGAEKCYTISHRGRRIHRSKVFGDVAQ